MQFSLIQKMEDRKIFDPTSVLPSLTSAERTEHEYITGGEGEISLAHLPV